jgi:chemotaxis protein CheC
MAQQLEFSGDVLDVLTELVNVGVGRAASSLSDLVNCRIELSVPSIQLSRSCELKFADQNSPSTVVVQGFSGELSGRAALAFPHESSLTLAALLSGVDVLESELDVELSGVLLEVGNILLNSLVGTLANEIQQQLDYTLPSLYSGPTSWQRLYLTEGDDDEDLLVADVHFRVQSREIQGSVVIVFACGSVVRLIQAAQPELLSC